MDLSIIIVNYETYDLTKQTIESVINQEQPFIMIFMWWTMDQRMEV